MQSVKTIDVFADNKLVGTLTGYGRGKVAFEYADSWLSDGFSVSPFSLPLNKKLYVPENTDNIPGYSGSASCQPVILSDRSLHNSIRRFCKIQSTRALHPVPQISVRCFSAVL